VHQEYVNAKHFIEKTSKQVTILSVTPKYAIFIETDENVYNVRKYPFTYMAQFKLARRLLLVPLTDLIPLANSLKACENTFLIHMSARCGSTLLAQLAGASANTRAISEPPALVAAHQLVNLKVDDALDIATAVWRMLCHKNAVVDPVDTVNAVDPEGRVDRVVVKCSPFVAPLLDKLATDTNPKPKLFFSTRLPSTFLPSFLKVYQVTKPPVWLMSEETLWKAWCVMLPFPYEDLSEKLTALKSDFEKQTSWYLAPEESGAVLYGLALMAYRQNIHHFQDVFVFDDKVEVIAKRFLAALGEPEDEAKNTMDVTLKLDSQNATFAPSITVANKEATATEKKAFDDMLEKLGMDFNSTISKENFHLWLQEGR